MRRIVCMLLWLDRAVGSAGRAWSIGDCADQDRRRARLLAAARQLSAGAGLRAAADRLAAGPLSRTDQKRLGRSRAAAPRQSSARPPWAASFIVAALVGATLVVRRLDAIRYLPIAGAAGRGAGGAGRVRRLVKLTTARARAAGRAPSSSAQTAIALAAAMLVYRLHAASTAGSIWSCRSAGHVIALGWWFVPLAALVIVGSSNAVNLADGLDGLAGGCLVCGRGAMALVVYASGARELGRAIWASHTFPAPAKPWSWPPRRIGGLLGFLWFNCHPASVFMGDTGSLPLGGLLGLLAVIARQELLLVAIGGVFVAEAVSVIVQVAWFRC